jgi:glycosyltransferase involved in cell wall biosynthesis
VFALATSREGCCNAILEALAAGRPVVTTPAGDNAHFVRDGVNGCIVPIDDAAATAAALERTLSRPDWDAEAISAVLQRAEQPTYPDCRPPVWDGKCCGGGTYEVGG